MTSELINVRTPGVCTSHTGHARRWKSLAMQFTESPCQGAMEIILRVSVSPRKTRAAAPEQRRDLSHRYTPLQQFLSDPFIGDTPVRSRESLWNTQPLQPGMIDGTGLEAVARKDWQMCKLRAQQRSGHRHQGGPGSGELLLGGLHQAASLHRRPQLGVQDSHPGSESVALPAGRFSIREPGQSPQMTPIGASQIAVIDASQPSSDGAGNGRLERCDTDPNPGLQVARTGLQQDTGLVPMGAHFFQNGRITAIQIQQDVAGVVVASVGLDKHVTALAIANAQKADDRCLGQLSGRPQTFTWEGAARSVMDQADQVELAGHGSKLATDCLQRDEEAAVQHEYPSHAGELGVGCTLMVCQCGSQVKAFTGNGRCSFSGLSQKRAQATAVPSVPSLQTPTGNIVNRSFQVLVPSVPTVPGRFRKVFGEFS